MPRDLICLMCPNGCHLKIDILGDQTVQVTGNRCDKGFAFARSILEHEGMKAAKIRIAGEGRTAAQETLADIASRWGISLKKTRPELIPAGSPERTVFREVIEDKDGRKFVLEEIASASFHAKMRIMKTLEFLSRRNMPRVTPYLSGLDGQYIQKYDGKLWQVMPFVHGEPLDRGKYVFEGWRARVLADFLADLREKSDGIPFFALEEKFSAPDYIARLAARIREREPDIVPRVAPVAAFLEKGFFPAYASLPVGFCHGDYHPMNIIWGMDDIISVIDWEFLGMKPEMYDMASMVGCLGVEDPESLVGDLVLGLVRELKDRGLFAAESWRWFFPFVVALRFAWLSEWLRKDDREMLTLELDYMDLLIENHAAILRAWGL